MKTKLFFLVLLLATFYGYSQNCGSIFTDSGGIDGNYSNGEDIVYVICPDTAAGNVTVEFVLFNMNDQQYDTLQIYDGDTVNAQSLGVFYGLSLPPSFSSTHSSGCLTFAFHSDHSVTRPGWQAIVHCAVPPCLGVTDLTQSSITENSIQLSWTPASGATAQTEYNIEYGVTGFVQGSGTIATTTLNNIDIIGLQSQTHYDFYIQAICDVGIEGFWNSTPLVTLTLCGVLYPPYYENFEDEGLIDDCWNQGNANSEDWKFANSLNPADHVGNAGDFLSTTTFSNGYYAYVDDSNPNSLNTFLESPAIDLAGVLNPSLAFYYISDNENSTQNIDFSVDIWNGTSWIEDVYTSNQNTSGWQQVVVDLSSFMNQTIKVRFDADEVYTNYKDDVAIDDVYVGEMINCESVDSISVNASSNEVLLSWNNGSSLLGVSWEIEYGEVDFLHGDGMIIPANTNPFTITSLTENTMYDVYIRTNCGSDGMSLWSGPIQFRTTCNAVDAPYLEDFENAVFDDCWGESDGDDSWEISGLQSVTNTGNQGNYGGSVTSSGGYFAFVDDSAPHALNTFISTGSINIDNLLNPTLQFYYSSHNQGLSNVDFSIDVWDGANWNQNFFFSNSNTLNGTWKFVALDLSVLNVTGPIKIKFIVNENNENDFADDLAIDDIFIGEKMECYPVNELNAINITENSATISWTDDNNTVASYNLEVYDYLQNLVVNELVNAQTYTLSSLNPLSKYLIRINSVCSSDSFAREIEFYTSEPVNI